MYTMYNSQVTHFQFALTITAYTTAETICVSGIIHFRGDRGSAPIGVILVCTFCLALFMLLLLFLRGEWFRVDQLYLSAFVHLNYCLSLSPL